MLLSLCGMATYAYDFEVDGLYYNLVSSSEKTCELVGCQTGITSISIPETVVTRGLPLAVISIKKSAFENNSSIQSVSFSTNKMEEIAENAFKNCINLKNVEFSAGLVTIGAQAFYQCPVEKLSLPSSVKNVGANSLSKVKNIIIEDGEDMICFEDVIPSIETAYIGRNISQSFISSTNVSEVILGGHISEIPPLMFYKCKNLSTIRIPETVSSIGDNAFHGCKSLHDIYIDDSESVLTLGIDTTMVLAEKYVQNPSWGVATSYNSYSYGLFNDIDLKTVYIGRDLSYSVTYKRGYEGYFFPGRKHPTTGYGIMIYKNNYQGSPFKGNVETFTFGDKVTRLDAFFMEGQNMKTFMIPENCKTLGNYCFYNCKNLQSIDLNNTDELLAHTFIGCNKLQDVKIGKTRIIGTKAFQNCENLSSIDLTNVDSIYISAFEGCIGLKKVIISDHVKEIQSSVFAKCSNLHMVSIGNSISFLPQGCFSECQKLQWLSLGNHLMQIQSGALSGCMQINFLETKSTTPPTFEDVNELYNVNKFNATLYIPEGSTSAYEKADVWKDFLFKEEKPIPDFVYNLPKPGTSDATSKNMVVKGELTGALINQINASKQIEALDLQAASIVLDNQNAYYETGKRIEDPYLHGDDVDVYRNAPYYSYKYYTAPTTVSGSDKEYSSSGRLINIITTCFSSELTNANLNGNLKSITLPSSLIKLGENAIVGTSLTELYATSTTPPTATASSFGNTNKSTCVLYVPDGCKSAYASATGWKDFKNIVEAVSDNYISVQPTNENRKVQLACQDDGAKYQWYKYIDKTDKVIDITNLLSTSSGCWENTGNGWLSNMHDAESAAILCYEHNFNVGDVLSFDWSVSSEEMFDQLQCYLGDELLLVASGEQSGSFNKTIESAISGKLTFVYIKDNITDVADDNAQISNVKISSSQEQTVQVPEAIVGETNNELSVGSVGYGDKVFCVVTLSDGKQIKSNEFVLEYANFIKKQPTPEDLSVELDTPEKGVTYQWYQGIETKTDSKDIVPSSSGSYNWTESNGVWTSGNKNVSSSSSIMTATIDVEAGDVLSFDWNVSSEAGYDYFYCTINGTQVLKKSGTDNGTYTQEFSATSKVTIEYKYTKDSGVNSGIDCATVSNIKLIRPSGFSNVVESEITGANTSTLDEMLIEGDATIWCVVTLPSGRILVSDKVQYNYNYALHFKKTHSEILSKTTATVSISDLEAIESALSDYANLPEDAQMKLQEEKALLDALKAKLDELMIPSDMYCLVLEKKDGSLEKYVLSDRPEISLSNNTVIVSSEKVQTDCPIVDFVRFYFEENKADEISVNTASSFAFKYNDNMVRISGADKAEVYSADGMKLMEQYATNGEIRMNISSFVPGLYIIKTDKKSIKIRK